MMTKLTILTLLTVSVLCNHHVSDSTAPNLQTAQYPTGQNPYELESDIIIVGTVITVMFAIIIVGGINIFLCYKCYNKRAMSKRIKEQMLFKKL